MFENICTLPISIYRLCTSRIYRAESAYVVRKTKYIDGYLVSHSKDTRWDDQGQEH